MKNKGIYIKLSSTELQKMKSNQKKLGFKNFSEFARKSLLGSEIKAEKKREDQMKIQNDLLFKINRKLNRSVWRENAKDTSGASQEIREITEFLKKNFVAK